VTDDRRAPLTFSVVIPTFERPALLARCLDRLASGAQSLDAARYEVIVTDDSRDATTQQLVTTRYPWVRWSPGPRRGPAANRNAGAALATAPFLVFADDDCIPDAEWLAGFVQATEARAEISPGRIVCREPWRSPLEHAPVNERGAFIWSCNMMVSREAFARLGGFDERFPFAHMEDLDLQDRARALGLAERFANSAVVDHPPRRNPWGARLGATHYAEVLYATLRDQPIELKPFLRKLIGNRVRAIRQRPQLVDGASALGSLLFEVSHVIANWSTWRARAAAAVQ
jgi:GT2 family glycosyltransferase